MSKKIKTIKKFSSHYKSFNFANPELQSNHEFVESEILQDIQGNIIEELKYNEDGMCEERNIYKYDGKGKLLEHTLHYEVDEVTEKRILKRDAEGKLLEEQKFYGQEAGEKMEYIYNEKGNVIERKFYDEEGVFHSSETFVYDEQESIVEHSKYGADQKLIERSTFNKNSAEHLIEEQNYGSKGEVLSKTIIRFDEHGKELSSYQTNAEGRLITSVENVFDEKGNVIEKHYKDFYPKTLRYAYDDKNRTVSSELLDGNGTLLRKSLYEYDDEDNIISEQFYEMDTTRGGRDTHKGSRYEYVFHEAIPEER